MKLLDTKGIAEHLGVSIRTVETWRYRRQLPEPEFTFSGVPVWKQKTIEKWHEKRKKPAQT